jgi:hypothetical protein
MLKKIKRLVKVSVKEPSDPKKVKEEIKKILNYLNKKGVNYCILRNYNNLEKQKDLDILIERRKDIRDIMNSFGFRKRSSYGPYASYKRKDIWLDFKIGCLAYRGFCFEKASEILSRKREYRDYFIPREEDEFIHIVLHPVLYKGYFKPKYKRRIKILLKKINKRNVRLKLEKKFGTEGKRLFNLIENGEYDSALKLKKKLFRKIFNFRDLPYCIIMISVEFLGGISKKVLK